MYCYSICNLINDKRYVGIATSIDKRWGEHTSGHGSKILHQAFKKYGVENFLFEILFEGNEQEAKDKEVEMIVELNTVAPHGYNLTLGGEGLVGFKHSAETRKRMSESRTGEKNGMYGKKHGVETRKKLAKKASQREITYERLETLRTMSKGAKNRHAQPLEINGIRYEYVGLAAEALGMNPWTLRAYVGQYKRKGFWPKTLSHLKIVLVQEKKEI